jgi:hypothetical protein
MNKKSMPHIYVEDKGDADLFFEYLEPHERQEFFEDLTGKDKPTIKLPDFGKIDERVVITNPDVKEITEEDLSSQTEKFIERFVRDKQKPKKPYLEYDDKKHKYELKPKYDLEKIIQEITTKK